MTELADFKLEYFTPTEEVPLCGHATIATFATLKMLGLLQKSKCSIETKAGILEMNVSEDGLVMMEQNKPQYYEYSEKREVISSTNETCICDDVPIQIVSTGLRDIILPVKDMESLDSLQPDFEAMKDLSREKDVVGIHAFVKQDPDSGVDAVCRNFAPLYGIDEESATGTASCALAGYLFRHNCKKDVYVFEQGYTMGLPSRIIVRVEHDGEAISKIYVGGYGYLVEERTGTSKSIRGVV